MKYDKYIPVLKGIVGERFNKKANYNISHAKSIDFRKQYLIAMKILKKWKNNES